MVFLRRRTDQEPSFQDDEEGASDIGAGVGTGSNRGFLFPRWLAMHYILEPMGKPETSSTNATSYNNITSSPSENTTTNHTQGGDAPLFVRPAIADTTTEHHSENGTVVEEETKDMDGGRDKYDHDSGEEKVAAMISEIQKKDTAKEEEEAEEEENEADEGEDQVIDEKEAESESSEVFAGEEQPEEDTVKESDTPEGDADSETVDNVSGNETNAFGGEGEEEESGEPTTEPLPIAKPVDEEEGEGTQDEEAWPDPPNDIEEEPTGNETDATENADGHDDEQGSHETDETSQPESGVEVVTPTGIEEKSAVDSKGTEAEAADEHTEAEDEDGQESSETLPTSVPNIVEEDITEGEEVEHETVSESDNEATMGEQDEAEEDATGDGEDASDKETSTQQPNEPMDTLEPGSGESNIDASPTVLLPTESSDQNAVAFVSPSPAPSSAATTENPTAMPTIIREPDTMPPNASSEKGAPLIDPTDRPTTTPSKAHIDIGNVSHDATPPPESGKTDTNSPSLGSLCRHPSGFVQQTNCKLMLEMQSHPIALSVAILVLSLWGCCFCRRLCKGRDRRDDRGEYREVAAQYDDMLFQGTFDDNYSASFDGDRSSSGSISDEEDDWTKGPNIEMGSMPHKDKKDDLTLEEMNG